MWGHMWGWDGSWSMGWGWFGLMHLAWWLLLIVAVVLVARAVLGRRWGQRDTALDILRERYARGEINEEEYQERKKLLDR